MVFRVPPTSFNRVCIRRVGWKVEHSHPRIPSQKSRDNLRAVNSCSIHKQKDLPRKTFGQNPQEVDHIRGLEVFIGRQKTKQKTGPTRLSADRHAGNCRDLGAIVPGFQDRRFSPGRERSFPGRTKLEARLIYEDNRRFLPAGFFLMRGKSSFRHLATSSSRLSRAIFSGF